MIPLHEWRRTGRTYRHHGHEVFFHDEGAGEPLVCIHGFPTASWDWAKIWRALTERFRVIAPDMLGYGYSAKPRGYRYSIFDQADLHEGLLASLGVHEAHVLAHDYGDTVAQELIARHDERLERRQEGLKLKSVCLLNGGLFPETHRPVLAQKLLASPLGPLVVRLFNERRFGSSINGILGAETKATREELAALWSLLEHNDGRAGMPRLIGYMAERRANRARWVGALQKTRVPLRLVDGVDDPVSGGHMAERYRALVPNPDIVLLPNTGHYPQTERPEEVLRAFLEFVGRHVGGDGAR